MVNQSETVAEALEMDEDDLNANLQSLETKLANPAATAAEAVMHSVMHERGELDTVDESVDTQSQRSDADDGGAGSSPASPQRQPKSASASASGSVSGSAPTTPTGAFRNEDGSVGGSEGFRDDDGPLEDGDTDVSDGLTGARALLARLKHTSIDKVWRTVLEGALLEARGGEVSTARRVLKYLMAHVPWYGPIYHEALRLEEKAEQPSAALRVVEQGLKEIPR